MTVKELIELLSQIPNKESECFMWAYTGSADEYLSINSVNIERGDGDIILSPIETHKMNDLTLINAWDKGFEVG